MTPKASTWDPIAPLPESGITVLEASAGTGKTWQIEALVLRLLVEEGIPIDRILAMTFTEAAAADLRARIRARLVEARDALDRRPAEEKDVVIAHVLRAKDPDAARAAIEGALSRIDDAPFHTIHGFANRVLQRLAFESNEELSLSLLADTSDELDEIVFDAHARMLSYTPESDLGLMERFGWKLVRLRSIAREMVHPLPIEVRPPETHLPIAGQGLIDALEERRSAVADFRAWWTGPRGEAARRRLWEISDADVPRGAKKKGGPKWLNGQTRGKWDAAFDAINEALENDFADRFADEMPASWKYLTREAIENKWTGPTPFHGPETEAFFPLVERFEDLQRALTRFDTSLAVVFASTVRGLFEERLRAGGLLTYDAMIGRLAERVRDPRHSSALIAAIRAHYDVALIDEFQDTDEAQWIIAEQAFGSSPLHRLFLVGDPKQAIYAFRGADLDVYLAAAASASERRFTLDVNYRSDAGVVDAMNTIWGQPGSAPFRPDPEASPAIDYVHVRASAQREGAGAPRAASRQRRRPFELRWADGESFERGQLVTRIGAGAALPLLAEASARLCGELIRDEAEGCAPEDIAILVRTHRQASYVQSALSRRRIPAVGGKAASIWESPVVGWLSAWLHAVAESEDEQPTRAFAATPIVGWSALELATALDGASTSDHAIPRARTSTSTRDWEALRAELREAAQAWTTHGFFSLFERALSRHQSLEGILSMENGERHATDLRHLVELAHREERRARLSPSALAAWLDRRRRGDETASERDDEADTDATRLETDESAVRVTTVHGSKGLEYPITLVPFSWATRVPDDTHEPALRVRPRGTREGQPFVDLHRKGTPERDRAMEWATEASLEESRRLVYVALTRAKHHVIAWDGAFAATEKDPPNPIRSVLRPQVASAETSINAKSGPDRRRKNAEEILRVRGAYEALADEHPESIGFTHERFGDLGSFGATIGATTDTDPATTPTLRARPWDSTRTLESAFTVASFSSMSRGARQPGGTSIEGASVEPPVYDASDSPIAVESSEPVLDPTLAKTPIRADRLPSGTEAGKFVHELFELLDFQTMARRSDRPEVEEEELTALIESRRRRYGIRETIRVDDADRSVTALVERLVPGWLTTPLGGSASEDPHGLTPDLRLDSLGLDARLDELKFDLSLARGLDSVSSRVREGAARIEQGAVRAVFGRLAEDASPAGAWAKRLIAADAAIIPRVRGFLTGSIDLVLRDGATGRYFVADYKTNRLTSSAPGEDGRRTSTLAHYTAPWLDHEMAHHGYHLQALLYTVALHRLLRDRLGERYAYDAHVGGHLYLFVRGMEGPETPRDPATGHALGVHAGRFPREVVFGLDAALEGRGADEVSAIVSGDARKSGGKP